jgi:hypothetical protein
MGCLTAGSPSTGLRNLIHLHLSFTKNMGPREQSKRRFCVRNPWSLCKVRKVVFEPRKMSRSLCNLLNPSDDTGRQVLAQMRAGLIDIQPELDKLATISAD